MRRFAVPLLFVAGVLPPLLANTPPAAPAIIEPSATAPVDPGDVHMATAPFHNDDGDALHCSGRFEPPRSGEIAAPVTGDYTFVLDSGGSSTLRIDGRSVIDTHATGAAPENPIHFEAGR